MYLLFGRVLLLSLLEDDESEELLLERELLPELELLEDLDPLEELLSEELQSKDSEITLTGFIIKFGYLPSAAVTAARPRISFLFSIS